ncbi:MAG: 3-hydroxyisobutyrate dehydrogenase [Cenarchaeum symbiont of Oopsacas minuta]|nr:3-hydroxyisobutyrate dehydrogenase [Cenarchaeum symbiont of Oopsacas minuta]
MKVGIIGTGMLGSAVGMRLIAKGAKLTVYNRTTSKTRNLSDAGAIIADNPASAASGCDIVITCVTDASALDEICFGSNGIAEITDNCPIVCDMSTISPDESKTITEKLASSSIVMLGTPVMGGPDAAAAGELVMMASGSEHALSKCRQILSIIACEIFYIGSAGNAYAIKLAMNLQIAMLALSISEGIMFVDKTCGNPKKFLKVLNSTYFGTGMSKKKAYGMIDGKVNPTFLLRNLKKDLDALSNTANKIGLDLPMGTSAHKIYKNATKNGYGNFDYTSIIEYLKKQ